MNKYEIIDIEVTSNNGCYVAAHVVYTEYQGNFQFFDVEYDQRNGILTTDGNISAMLDLSEEIIAELNEAAAYRRDELRALN